MTRIWIDGVLVDYSHKMSGRQGGVNAIYEANKEKKRRKAALTNATALKHNALRREKLEEDRQTKLGEYFAMGSREL